MKKVLMKEDNEECGPSEDFWKGTEGKSGEHRTVTKSPGCIGE